ncbi:MAG: AsmA family protein [Hydrogenophilales bacterium]|nr:AsmA family protein [Hydrogenophilales bacterium]
MDLSRVYTKTSKGILEGNTKSRELTREHGRVLALIDGKSSVSDLLEKNSRLSESRLAAILDELADLGMIRQLNGALAVDDLGFSSTIIVDEANTQAFFEAQAHLEREQRRAEDREVRVKEQDRAALLNEVKADIEAEAEAIKRELAEQNAREAQAKAQEAAQREAEARAQAEEKARQGREEAEAHAQAVAEHARKQLEIEAKARAEAEARAKALEAEVFVRAEAARKAKQEAEQRAQAEADAKARMEAEKKAREQAEKQALAAEKAREAAEENARLAKEAEDKANARRELEARMQAEEEAQRRSAMEARMREMEQDKRRAEEEAQALAKALDEARIATELEARVKRRIEARAREDEEARQRAEAEARAKLEEESRLRQEAEARALAEAEARRLAEEAKIKAGQEAQAQLEAERLARKEAEARAVAEAEAQRQAEAARLAAERHAEEERKAQVEAEARAQAEEEAARRQAEAEQRRIEEAEARAAEQARLAAEQLAEEARRAREEADREAQAMAEARAKAEEEARRAEAERLRVEAEARAVAEAEEAVRLEAEAVKRQLEEQQRAEEARLAHEAAARQQEAERVAAEAAAAAARTLAEARERAEAEARARDEARQQAREAAEAAARAEAEEALRRVEEAARREEAEEAHLRAEAQARAMAAAQGEAVFPFLTARKRTRIRFDKRMIKPAAYGVAGLLVFALAALHLISFNFYIPKMERQLTESLGQRVVVKDIRFSVYPAPHLKLEGVAIGDLADVRVGTARLFPVITSWFAEEKTIRRVEMEALALSEDSVGALSVWSQYQAQAAPVQFERILVKDAKLANRLLDLFAFDADVEMDHGRFAKARIKSSDQRITIDFTPQADALAIQLAATHSVLPLEPRIQFEELKISAIARPGSMTLSHVEGQLYGGSLSGNARIEWGDGWILTSDLGVRQVAIEPSLPLFTRNIKASGALEAKIRLTTKSSALETLMDAPQVQATFRVRDGEISGVDLVRAIQSARSSGNIGGKTHFNELSGYLQLANGRYQYRQLKLLTGMMSANGNLEFSSERNLSGNLLGELRTRATVLRTPFTLGGTLATPTLKVASPLHRAAPVKAIQEEQ